MASRQAFGPDIVPTEIYNHSPRDWRHHTTTGHQCAGQSVQRDEREPHDGDCQYLHRKHVDLPGTGDGGTLRHHDECDPGQRPDHV